MMGLNTNSPLDNGRFSRFVISTLRWIFRHFWNFSPEMATRTAVWLFTKPKRSAVFPGESQLLSQAKSYFLASHGYELAVMEWGSGPTVLCVHGWSSRGIRFKTLIGRLVKSGYRVVVFDAPAHGRSSGSHTDVMDYAHAIRAVALNAGSIHALVAHSFGAAATLLALEKGLKIRKAVFFSALNGMRGPIDYLAGKLGFSDPMRERVKHSFEKKFHRNIDSLEAIHIVPQLETPPLLIIHDKYDPVLPFHNALDLASVWKNSGLLTTHGIGHEATLDALTVINKVLDFLATPGD